MADTIDGHSKERLAGGGGDSSMARIAVDTIGYRALRYLFHILQNKLPSSGLVLSIYCPQATLIYMTGTSFQRLEAVLEV